MSKKRLDFIVSFLLIVLGIAYLVNSIQLQQISGNELSSGLFPAILGVLLILLCSASMYQTIKKKDVKIHFEGKKKNLITIGIIILYLAAWQLIGYFYILTFLLMFSLITFYRHPLGFKKTYFVTNLLVSLGLTGFIYLLFSKLMYIAF